MELKSTLEFVEEGLLSCWEHLQWVKNEKPDQKFGWQNSKGKRKEKKLEILKYLRKTEKTLEEANRISLVINNLLCYFTLHYFNDNGNFYNTYF